MVQHRRFMDLALDDEGLHTPDGTFRLADMTKVDIRRRRSSESGTGGYEPSVEGAVGGALLGGALAGPLGFVGGGLLGSRVHGDHSDTTGVPRIVSATITLESPDLAYVTRVDRDRIEEAEAFIAAVRVAAGLD